MKKLLIILLLAARTLTLMAAGQPYLITISAKVKPDIKAYLLYQSEGKKYIDSAVQKNGVYTFKGMVDKPLISNLILDHGRIGIQKLIKQRSPAPDFLKFYLHPGKFSVYTTSLISEGRFKDSAINSDYLLLQTSLASLSLKQQKNSEQLIAEKDPGNFPSLKSKADSLNQIRRAKLKVFIQSHPNSYIALTSLQEYSSSVDAETESLFKKLSAEIRSTVLGREMAKLIADEKALKPGMIAPDFTQKDVNGKPVKLSDFSGKYVLLDFWASWCAPCRIQSPELVKTYAKYKNRNFTILGISLDQLDGKEKWEKAIKDDGLNWTQVSDLKHWDNQVAKLYSVRAIPETILIDPSGRIIAKYIFGSDLDKKLEEILPK